MSNSLFSWLKVFIIALDIDSASLIFTSYDCTISSHCGIALRLNKGRVLMALGRILNHIQPNHCEIAISDDLAKARTAINYLSQV
jgi:hypothetical protein